MKIKKFLYTMQLVVRDVYADEHTYNHIYRLTLDKEGNLFIETREKKDDHIIRGGLILHKGQWMDFDLRYVSEEVV